MRNILGILMLSLVLFGCDATGKITPESIVAEIQKDCGIVVTISDIAALITANPAVVSTATIAQMVCDAFKAQKGATGMPKSGTLNVNGTVVHYVVKD